MKNTKKPSKSGTMVIHISKLANLHFSIISCQLTSNKRSLPKYVHPMDTLTTNNNKNHHKIHQKVLLWSSISKKLTKWHFFDHFTARLTSIDVKYRLLTKN